MDNPPNNDEDLKTKLNREVAKISWEELQRFYASGAVIAVSQGMDLIEVASQFSCDNTSVVGQWLTEGSVYKVDDQQAAQWYEQQAVLWAVVIAPWVLVQTF